MKKKILLLSILFFTVVLSAAGTSAQKLMINPEEFYDKFCRIASETYGSRFCNSVLMSSSSGYYFTTTGGFTVTLESTSLKKDMSRAVLKMPLSANLSGKAAKTAMYAHFLTADNNIFATEQTFSVLENYVENISRYLGKELKYDRIRILSTKGSSSYLMTAYK